MIEVRRFEFRSPEYEQVLDLRRQVLRIPLGLVYSEEDIESERDEIHLGAFDGDKAVGSMLLKLISNPNRYKMRQVAVHPNYQRQGIGKLLVEAAEELVRATEFPEIMLFARETAIPFYEALGYKVVGPQFYEVGIAHRRMTKDLRPPISEKI